MEAGICRSLRASRRASRQIILFLGPPPCATGDLGLCWCRTGVCVLRGFAKSQQRVDLLRECIQPSADPILHDLRRVDVSVGNSS